MSFDHRTRTDTAEPPLDPAGFFDEQLPAAFEQAHELIAPAIDYRPPRPLAVRVGQHEWTLHTRGSSSLVSPGRSGTTPTVCLSPRQLADLVHDQITPNGLFTRGELLTNAPLSHVFDWWLLLRGALDGEAPYVPGSVSLNNRHGEPLDPSRTFTLADPPDSLRAFLLSAGFLRLRGVFSAAEMAALSAEFDRGAAQYSPGDGRSFWGQTNTGEQRLVRMQYFNRVSELAARLVTDPRVQAIAGVPGMGHEPNLAAGLVEALIKPTGIAGRISDFPWHKDCSLGRHSYECCSLTLGISVTGSNRSRGQLRMLAGSHRALMWPVLEQPGLDLPRVDLPTRAGDVTLHLSCTMHMSSAPLRGTRRVLYLGFRLPEADAGAADATRARTGLRTTDLAWRR